MNCLEMFIDESHPVFAMCRRVEELELVSHCAMLETKLKKLQEENDVLKTKETDMTHMIDTVMAMMKSQSSAANAEMDMQQKVFSWMKRRGYITSENHHEVPRSVRVSLEGFFCSFGSAPDGGLQIQNMRTLNEWYMACIDKDGDLY